LRIIPTKQFPLILLRGYAIKDKEIKNIFRGASELKILDNKDNFSKRVIFKKDNHWQVLDCLNTPIFSVIIIPKNCGASSSDSKKVLYSYNLHESLVRLNKIKNELENEELKDTDIICEKSNSVRRVFEYVLKVECCYRYRQINAKKDYSDLMLGDLIGLIKEFREDHLREILNKITIWSNELSHESGKPITKEKALLLVFLTISYTALLRAEIKLKPYPHLEY
jgi:hypothetical protein